MAVREGRWDCQYCGTKGNLGRHRKCKNCNRSRPEGTNFYLVDENEVKSQKLREQARLGTDWLCEFCGSSNSADASVCGSCGAPREKSSPTQKVKRYAPGAAPKSGDMTFGEERTEEAAAPKRAGAKRKLPLIAALGVGAFALLCLGVIAFFVFGGRDADATVTGFEWERAIAIEAYRTVTEEDWSLPSGGRLISQREEIHHYDEVIDHYETRQREVSEQVKVGTESYVCGQEDLGNGFFEDVMCERDVYETQYHTETYEEPIYVSVPVYQTLFVYDIDKWVVDRTEVASEGDHQPYWPRSDLADNEREGERSERYTMYFTDKDGETYEYETELSEWQAYEQGQSVTLKLGATGELKEIDSP